MEKNSIKDIYNKHFLVHYLNNLKFILILLVVIAQFTDLCKKQTDIIHTIILFIYTFHMPLLIFVAGIFSKKYIEKKEKGRVFKLLILSFLFQFSLFVISRIIYHDNTYLIISKVNFVPWYIFSIAIFYAITMKLSNFNKKYLLIISIFLSLIVGYDPKIGDLFCLSRIIVFYPFFLIGYLCDKKEIEKISNSSVVSKIISILFLVIIGILMYIFIDKIYFIKGMFTGRNSYYVLPKQIQNFGFFIRLLTYVTTIFISIAVLRIIPKRKTVVSQFGDRYLTVYIFHAFVYYILFYEGIRFRAYKLLLLSLFVTLMFSLKIFSIPIDKWLNFNLEKKSKKLTISYQLLNRIVNIFMIVIMICILCYFLIGR